MESPVSPAPSASGIPASAGAALRVEREAQGLSVDDISQRLKLSAAQINAIETADHARLPGAVFERGFIRSYARLLKLDGAKLLEPRAPAEPETATAQEADRHAAPIVQPLHEPAPDSIREVPREHSPAFPRVPAHEVPRETLRVSLSPASHEVVRETIVESSLRSGPRDALEPSPYRRLPALIGGIAVVVLGLAYYEFVINVPDTATGMVSIAAKVDTSATPAVPAESTAPVAAEFSTAAASAKPEAPIPALALKKSSDPESGATRGLHFVFNGESWVEVRDGEGNIVFSRVNDAGSERRVQGSLPLSVVVGSSSRVQLSYNGKAIDLLAYTRDDVARLKLE